MDRNVSCTMTNVRMLNACPPLGCIDHSFCDESMDAFLTCRSKD